MLKSITLIPILRRTFLQSRHLPTTSPAFPSASPLLRTSRLSRRGISSGPYRSVTRSSRLSAWRPSTLRRLRNARQNSSKPSSSTVKEISSQEAQSLSGRFKQLSRKYGWAAVGVYAGLSVLDFPFCFLAVRLIGPDRIGEAEHAVVNGFWRVVAVVAPSVAPHNEETVEGVDAAAQELDSKELELHKHKENASKWSTWQSIMLIH